MKIDDFDDEGEEGVDEQKTTPKKSEGDKEKGKDKEKEKDKDTNIPRRHGPHGHHHGHRAPPGALFKDKENSHYVERYVLRLIFKASV